MWTVFKDQKNHCRMYYCGVADWTSSPTMAACWADRRVASTVASEFLDHRPGPVDAPYTYGEEFVRMPKANPTQRS